MKDKNCDTKRIDSTCIKAIEDIVKKINIDIEEKLKTNPEFKYLISRRPSFTFASHVLGEKYFRGQLGVIPYDEILFMLKKEKKLKRNLNVI